MRKRALVIAPGRGTYNKPELGYLYKHHADKAGFIAMIDEYRAEQNQTTITDLDQAATYSIKQHTRGDNASPLIYACAYGDYLSIDRDKFDIVAATGNSMGWYIALGCGGALSELNTVELINTMGTMMQNSLIGGQLIYPIIDDNWNIIEGKREEIMRAVTDINAAYSPISSCPRRRVSAGTSPLDPRLRKNDNTYGLYISIELGGFIVFGGSDKSIKELHKRLPPAQDRFPLILPNHAAFHTPLQKPISTQALEIFSSDMLSAPTIPLIDGRGYIWRAHATDKNDIYNYTLDHQVCEYYDFTRAVHVAMKEYSPDCIIILGAGSTLGGAVAQSLIQIGWDGLNCKDDFIKRQASDNPIIYAMGIDSQRKIVTNK